MSLIYVFTLRSYFMFYFIQKKEGKPNLHTFRTPPSRVVTYVGLFEQSFCRTKAQTLIDPLALALGP
jgi:hypothetical protein